MKKERQTDSLNFMLAIYYYGLQPLGKFYCTSVWMQNVVTSFFYKTTGIWGSIALPNEISAKITKTICMTPIICSFLYRYGTNTNMAALRY